MGTIKHKTTYTIKLSQKEAKELYEYLKFKRETRDRIFDETSPDPKIVKEIESWLEPPF